MIVLGIETSCDETSVALVEDNTVIANLVYSQIQIHKKFGGVVPEIAAREHLKKLPILFSELINQTNINIEKIDGIAVTKGPGLIGALLVGVSFAKGLALRYKKPLVGINHIIGHVYANYIAYPELKPPYIVLMVSGGHTLILKVEENNSVTILGRSVDDAVGEAFDKIARLLGLGYPGGPEIDKISKNGNPNAFNFPKPKMYDPDYNFSFSGLKTAVLYEIKRLIKNGYNENNLPIADLAASAQEVMIDVLLHKVTKAARDNNLKNIVLAGGVAANSRLREKIRALSEEFNFYIPPLEYCSDNAAMIARAGLERIKSGENDGLNFEPVPNFFEMMST
ncbi:tRNA (adenosine(37)-N6)-threonylcarbamoyltransferase complex transferase subunit TsaD [Fervidobacterium sp. 2310opik-2]|uniref:tRNA (adenosine(37)-N6)-threonylcarbamoyltransferase complex transferase subunit TsaD n=1 Tax=Fervidobacterium sp. 2310opik-2 TaxID=1755815 RepID=UPI0013E08ADB|nr:tRNA (adenosine(37)-N6)-threonylcarbamoyltransferase complex transferase subunit TsaD [Fervidobacterium sp. 2310opik-2]KAF2961620.1 tRNA threonylcarbamoyl adenosine modification protein TsaD [Fervidobacterium sp. 2310opik-2]